MKFPPPLGYVYIGPFNRKWHFIQLPQIQVLEHRISKTSHLEHRLWKPHIQPWNKGSQIFQRLHTLNTNQQIPKTLSLNANNHWVQRPHTFRWTTTYLRLESWNTETQTPHTLNLDPKYLRNKLGAKTLKRVQTPPTPNTDLQLPYTQTLEYRISKASETSHPEYKPQRPQTQILEHRISKSSETSPWTDYLKYLRLKS